MLPAHSARTRASAAVAVYGWFIEGFDACDLIDARMPLESYDDDRGPRRGRPSCAARRDAERATDGAHLLRTELADATG